MSLFCSWNLCCLNAKESIHKNVGSNFNQSEFKKITFWTYATVLYFGCYEHWNIWEFAFAEQFVKINKKFLVLTYFILEIGYRIHRFQNQPSISHMKVLVCFLCSILMSIALIYLHILQLLWHFWILNSDWLKITENKFPTFNLDMLVYQSEALNVPIAF